MLCSVFDRQQYIHAIVFEKALGFKFGSNFVSLSQLLFESSIVGHCLAFLVNSKHAETLVFLFTD